MLSEADLHVVLIDDFFLLVPFSLSLRPVSPPLQLLPHLHQIVLIQLPYISRTRLEFINPEGLV